jgi:RNA polymerase sigma-70 factor (ECF subfamily)
MYSVQSTVAPTRQHSGIVVVFSLEIAEGRVQTIRGIVNPDKLRHLGPVVDAWRLLRERGTGDAGTD